MSNTAIPPNNDEMTLVQHLLELRNLLTKGIIAIIVLFLILFPFANDLYVYVSEPLSRFLPEGTSMIATGVASPFLTPFKLSFVLAIYIAMPFLLYQIWKFIAPALYKHERQLIAPIMFFSSFLFYAGGLFAFYVVFPLIFGFLTTSAPDGVTIATDIALYLDFIIKMFFAFGFAFEVPVVVVILILTGMVSPQKLSHIRPYVVVGAFVIGMLLTPPDIISQTLLAVPMWLLYETGIIVGAFVKKRRKTPEQREEAEAAEQDHTDKAAPKKSSEENSILDPSANSAEEEIEFDNRYADQVDDDLDWDAEFDNIDSDFGSLDREYQKKQDDKQAEDKAKDVEKTNDSSDTKEDEQAKPSDSK